MADRRRLCVLDTSAFALAQAGRLPAQPSAALQALVEAERVVLTTPVLLEIGRSAGSTSEHRSLMDALRSYPRLPIDAGVEHRALRAQAVLADRGQHQLPVPDLLIAALAERHDADVLHYDAHFDVLTEHSGLRFGSVWVAPRGSL